MVPAATEGLSGKRPDGRAPPPGSQARLPVRPDPLDQAGRPVCDLSSSSYQAILEAAGRFAALAYAEAHRRGAAHTRQLVSVMESPKCCLTHEA